MQVDYFKIARRGRIRAIESLSRGQMELPGFNEPTLWKDASSIPSGVDSEILDLQAFRA